MGYQIRTASDCTSNADSHPDTDVDPDPGSGSDWISYSGSSIDGGSKETKSSAGWLSTFKTNSWLTSSSVFRWRHSKLKLKRDSRDPQSGPPSGESAAPETTPNGSTFSGRTPLQNIDFPNNLAPHSQWSSRSPIHTSASHFDRRAQRRAPSSSPTPTSVRDIQHGDDHESPSSF